MAGNQPINQEKNTEEVRDKSNTVKVKKKETSKVIIGSISLGQKTRENVEETREGITERSTANKGKEAAKSINDGVLGAAVVLHGENIVVHGRRTIGGIGSLGLRRSHGLLRSGDFIVEVEFGGFLILNRHDEVKEER